MSYELVLRTNAIVCQLQAGLRKVVPGLDAQSVGSASMTLPASLLCGPQPAFEFVRSHCDEAASPPNPTTPRASLATNSGKNA